ncbi:hypothetical protein BG011_007431 [Mortierella polycephala]|uniref:Uncharacterized protein n=1 Tax=Mortierella polycephala TaxID=41804 RepID=A0A9P6PR37_9FUNG|nr:hypothetical protein BG011_007431 [Mortierella polycephala]
MECLRNLPSKSTAFSTATYERVRGGDNTHRNRPFFTTQDQTPHQFQPSSDENLILDALRQKKMRAVMKAEEAKRPATPDIDTGTGKQPSSSSSGPSSTSAIPQQQTQPRLFKRPRIALSYAAAATAAVAASTSSRSTSSSSSSPSSGMDS